MDIKLISYNIQSWDVNERRIEGILDLINRHNPDIICFQEVTIFWYSLLKKKLSNIYAFTGRDRYYGDKNQPKRDFERNSIAFRKDRFKEIKSRTYWLGPDVNNPSIFDKCILKRIFTTVVLEDLNSHKKIQVISTHFDDRFEDIREKQGLILANYFKQQKGPLILAGDFNSEPKENAYRALKQVAIDVGEEFNETGKTWHTYDKYPPERIDYIFRNKDIKIKSFDIIKDVYKGLPPSDHYPLKSTVAI